MTGTSGEAREEATSAAERDAGLSFLSIGRAAAILTGAAGAVQVLAIIREVFVAAQVGLSVGYDALLIALVIPTTFAGVLTAGPVTALVPAYLAVRTNDGLEEARRLAGAIIVWVGASGLVVWLLLEAFGPFAIGVAGPGLDASARDAAVSYLHIVAPLAFVAGISAIVGGICQAEERFRVLATSSFVGAATNLAITLILWLPLGLTALAVANLAGALTGGAVLALAAFRSPRAPRLTIWTTREQLSTFARHAGPLTLSSAILQVNGVVDRAIATLIAPGAVSALRFADVLVRAPIGAISPGWSAALYPSLVRVASTAGAGLGSATSRALRYVLAAFVPIAVLTIAVAPVAVDVGFGRGAFDDRAVERTAEAVAAFAPLIVVTMCYPPFTGALNARRRAYVLLAGGAINVALNLVLDVVLGLTLGAAGIALSSSLTAIVVLIFFARRLARSEGDFVLAPIRRTVLLAIASCVPVAIPIGLVCWLRLIPEVLFIDLAALLAFGALGLLGYAVIAIRLGLDEVGVFAQLIRSAFPRRVPGA